MRRAGSTPRGPLPPPLRVQLAHARAGVPPLRPYVRESLRHATAEAASGGVLEFDRRAA